MKQIILVSIVAVFAACSPSSQPSLVASDVAIMESMPGMKMTAAYMTLTNTSANDIRITRITSPQFEKVELHETIVEDDVSRMREVPQLTVPASGSVTLEPGGMHLMLMRPTGDSDTISLKVWSDDAVLLALEAGYTQR